MMRRDDAISALTAQPFDAEVRVNLIGRYVDVAFVHYDADRQTIVLDLEGEDVHSVLQAFFRQES